MTAHGEANGLADSGGLLRFWFDEAGPDRWFDPDPAFDEALRQKFGALQKAAASGALDGWMQDSDGALALVLALDQLPRNLFRSTPQAFATDQQARAATAAALARGFDLNRPADHCLFFYMPLMHSEFLADQNRSVSLLRGLQSALPDNYAYALKHRDIIDRFGRFPHRNAILGRRSTPGEEAFLRSSAGI